VSDDPRSDELELHTKKKPIYPIGKGLRHYLKNFGREVEMPVTYSDLEAYMDSVPLYDNKGEDTLWEVCVYPSHERDRLNRDLTRIYIMLKAEGEDSLMEHLYCDRIDYCSFGNTNPFRIRIVNARNDNQDYYYIKKGDASRIYGLELEHLLSPNRMHYLVGEDTLVEEHIVGIPGDIFITNWLGKMEGLKDIRVAKELVKFNERCFVRLLGDMRSYNFVMVVTPDFEGTQIRIRAMDFDQQSYSGRMNFYRPQFFKDNSPLVNYCLKHLDKQTAYQYIREEQALMHRRVTLIHNRLRNLLRFMSQDRVAPPAKVRQLREQLTENYKDKRFMRCDTMGEIVSHSLERLSEIAQSTTSEQLNSLTQ